jgi:hypothetical protein
VDDGVPGHPVLDRSRRCLPAAVDEAGRNDLIRRPQQRRVLRTADPVGEVAAVVADDDQGTAGGYAGRGSRQQRLSLRRRQVDVDQQHQVVVGLGPPLQQVGLFPANRHPGGSGQLGGLGQGHGGEVDAQHRPALGGQPDCIASFAAAEVDRAARRSPRELPNDELVGLRRPQQSSSVVPGVPRGGIHE